jgi:RHS repeat-associated protein
VALERGPVTGTTELNWYHYDGLASVVALSAENSDLFTVYHYSEYGQILAGDMIWNHYTYTGQEWDIETNFYHYYARSYSPIDGAWITADPFRGQIQNPLSQNRYLYVEDNPIVHSDLFGYAREDYTMIGTYVHNVIQAEYLNSHPFAVVDNTISTIAAQTNSPCVETIGESNPFRSGYECGQLRPDIADPISYEIYEIKPSSSMAEYSSWNNGMGWWQMMGYVECLGGSPWHPGYKWTPPRVIFAPNGSEVRITYDYSLEPGMIYYDYEEPGEPGYEYDYYYDYSEKEQYDFNFEVYPVDPSLRYLAAAILIIGTLGEDILTGGIGVVDDPASIGIALYLLNYK